MSVEAGWVSVADAGRYVSMAPEVVSGAIARGELAAVVKPVTRREGRPQYRVAIVDLDAWMRSQPSAREAMLAGGTTGPAAAPRGTGEAR